MLGVVLGIELGFNEGSVVGIKLGSRLGSVEGSYDGLEDGADDGMGDGSTDGMVDVLGAELQVSQRVTHTYLAGGRLSGAGPNVSCAQTLFIFSRVLFAKNAQFLSKKLPSLPLSYQNLSSAPWVPQSTSAAAFASFNVNAKRMPRSGNDKFLIISVLGLANTQCFFENGKFCFLKSLNWKCEYSQKLKP